MKQETSALYSPSAAVKHEPESTQSHHSLADPRTVVSIKQEKGDDESSGHYLGVKQEIVDHDENECACGLNDRYIFLSIL